VTEEQPSGGPTRQLRLELGHPPRFEREHFVVSACNRDAVAALESWPGWPGGGLVLVGPEGSGKTHLARTWERRSGAVVAGPDTDIRVLPLGPVLVEDADRRSDDTTARTRARAS
jgi:chromosomal replication initiation ATPase DnaA